MKKSFPASLLLTALFVLSTSFVVDRDGSTPAASTLASFNEKECNSVFNGDVKTYELKDNGNTVGHSIWISRKSKRAKAKYFAHKLNGESVHERYVDWRTDRSVVLMSSGAYATGWNNSDKPVGITVDNGNIVNNQYFSSMDGLVIVFQTGGIVVSNIDDGDLWLEAIGQAVDVRDYSDRARFLKWAQSEQATVFQTHLLAYKNNLLVGEHNSSSKKARRKFLILAKSGDGELFHMVFYMKKSTYTLYDAASNVLDYLRNKSMDVIAMVNLDTGGFDILSTGGEVRDCSGRFITGSSNDEREDMTNLLAYEYEED